MEKSLALDRMRDICKDFLYLDIDKIYLDMFCCHPFTSNIVVYADNKFLNLKDSKEMEIWRREIIKLLDKTTSFPGFVSLVNKPYRLIFADLCKRSYIIDEEDIALFLKNNWNSIEFSNSDKNVTNKKIKNWFKQSPKDLLMNQDDYLKYLFLPSKVTIYRGVNEKNRKNKSALSWTLDKNVAIWFANRFDLDEKEVWSIEIPKNKILCFWNYESEIIADTRGEKIKIEKI